MKILKKVLIFLAVIALLVFCYCWYLGLFNSVKIEEKKAGGFWVAGLEFKGPYSQSGKFMKETEKKLNQLGIPYTMSFGIYYDDPKMVAPENCRTLAGCILDASNMDKKNKLTSNGFKLDSIGVEDAMVSEFPIKSDLSYMIGALKVYPAFTKYGGAHSYQTNLSLELYDTRNSKITYIMQFIRKK